MAKVIITLRDKKDGTVGCTVDFKPSLKVGKKETPAQSFAGCCLEAMAEAGKAEVSRVR